MIDESKCIKCGVCVKLYPEMFAVDDDGTIKEKPVDKAYYNAVIDEVIDACPTDAVYKQE